MPVLVGSSRHENSTSPTVLTSLLTSHFQGKPQYRMLLISDPRLSSRAFFSNLFTDGIL
jgi:hypothetical protein